MLTSGDVQFTPPQSKIRDINSSIVAMISGDIALASELLVEVRAIVDARIKAEPQNWWNVKDIADLWRAAFFARLRRESEQKWIAPLGLTLESFIKRNKEFSDDLSGKLAQELLNFDLPGMEIIFAGIDPTGPHLYVATGGEIRCMDAVGFAAIGSGAYHARSQLMFFGHTAGSPLNRSVYRVYAAKKRAEVAPGVGADTDTFVAWGLGGSAQIRDEIIEIVKVAYAQTESQSAKIVSAAEDKVHEEIKQLLEQIPKTSTQATPETRDGETSSPVSENLDGTSAEEEI
jgi:hypothetical protein